MKKIEKKELLNISGGGLGLGLIIGGAIVFIIGVIDGFMRPLKCN